MIVAVVLSVVAAIAFGVFGCYVLLRAAIAYRDRQRADVLEYDQQRAGSTWLPESHVYRTDETYDNYCARAARNGLRPAPYRNWLVVMTAGRGQDEWERLMRENEGRWNR